MASMIVRSIKRKLPLSDKNIIVSVFNHLSFLVLFNLTHTHTRHQMMLNRMNNERKRKKERWAKSKYTQENGNE